MKNPLRVIALLISCLVADVATAQVSSADVQLRDGQSFNLNDPFKQLYSGIDGSPYFLSEALLPALIQFGDKTVPQLARFNTVTQQIEYREGKNVLTPNAPVTGFSLINKGDTIQFVPVSIDRPASPRFGRLLAKGNGAMLVLGYTTSIKKDDDVLSSNLGKRSFDQRETYYLVTDGKAVLAKRSGETLKKLCPACPEKPVPGNWTAFAEAVKKQGSN